MKTQLEHNFLSEGGDHDFLIKGLKSVSVPRRLQKISILNSIFAYEPWNLTVEDMKFLLEKDNFSEWSNLSELISATLIILQYQKTALITENLGIKLKNPKEEMLVFSTHKEKNSKRMFIKCEELKNALLTKSFLQDDMSNTFSKEDKKLLNSGYSYDKNQSKFIFILIIYRKIQQAHLS